MTHIANRIHPSYFPMAAARELSQAYMIGADAFRFDGANDQKWVRPTASEYASASDPLYIRGYPVFEDRLRRWTTTNVYGDSIAVSASQPINANVDLSEWPDILADRCVGKYGGLTGAGQGLMQMMEITLESVFFSGMDFIRLFEKGNRAFWVREPADNFLYWEYGYSENGLVLLDAVLEGSIDGTLVRRVYTVTSEGVEWRVYRAKEKDSYKRRVYALTDKDVELSLEPENKPWKSGLYRGLTSVPVEAFAATWDEPYVSMPPFKDAAEIQLKVDRGDSHLEDFRLRVATAAVFVIAADLTVDENGQTVMPKAGAARLLALPEGSSGDWKSLDSSFIPQEIEVLEDLKNEVRRKCLDPLDAQYKGDVKATQIAVADARSMSYLDLAFLAMAPGAKRLLRATAQMEGIPVTNEPQLTFSRRRPKAESDRSLDRVLELYDKGVVLNRQTVLAVAQSVDDSISADVWAKILEMEGSGSEGEEGSLDSEQDSEQDDSVEEEEAQ